MQDINGLNITGASGDTVVHAPTALTAGSSTNAFYLVSTHISVFYDRGRRRLDNPQHRREHSCHGPKLGLDGLRYQHWPDVYL